MHLKCIKIYKKQTQKKIKIMIDLYIGSITEVVSTACRQIAEQFGQHTVIKLFKLELEKYLWNAWILYTFLTFVSLAKKYFQI